MKKIINACLTLELISPLLAGNYGTSPNLTPSSNPSDEGTSWFVGGGANYMFDELEEFYFCRQVGCKLNSESALFLEGGWIGAEDDINIGGFNFNTSVDIIPVTLNYSYEFASTENFDVSGWRLGSG